MIERTICRSTLALAAATIAVTAAEAQNAVPSSRQLTVDLALPIRPATHVASGSLYGLGKEGAPDALLLRKTKPLVFTQMAPAGTQVPVGDALKVAPMAAAAGAKVTIRMPDIYPNFPYRWRGWADWQRKVEGIVDATLRSGAMNIYAYELWNEPNWTWDFAAAGTFVDAWKRTFQLVRTKDRATPIMGPSIDRYDEAYLRAFLTAAKASDSLPDIVSWHELGFPEGNYQDTANTPHIADHIRRYRALEIALGITPRPIAINEFGVTTEEGVPGSMVRYFAQFERGGVESANVAFWFGPGRMSNIVTDDSKPNGGWWLFKWYGDMTGQMVMTTPAAATELSLDGIANLEADGRTAHVLLGGAEGDNLVVIQGFGRPFRDIVHVSVEAAPWFGPDFAVHAPQPVFEGNFLIKDGKISVPLTGMDKAYGYRMTISPAGWKKTRYEAERAASLKMTGSSAPTASDASYVPRFGKGGQPIRFAVDAPKAGDYDMRVRFANGSEGESTNVVRVNKRQRQSITYPRTGGWLADERTGLAAAAISLKQGTNVVELLARAGQADIDYAEFSPRKTGSIWMEAERALLGGAAIEPSSYASSQLFVAPNGNDSFAEFSPDVSIAGTYMMDIGYANLSRDKGEQALKVNGIDVARVVYPSTGARFRAVPTKNPRRIKTVPVELKAGRNTIRLTYDGIGYVELDYIELRRVAEAVGRGSRSNDCLSDPGTASGRPLDRFVPGRFVSHRPSLASCRDVQMSSTGGTSRSKGPDRL